MLLVAAIAGASRHAAAGAHVALDPPRETPIASVATLTCAREGVVALRLSPTGQHATLVETGPKGITYRVHDVERDGAGFRVAGEGREVGSDRLYRGAPQWSSDGRTFGFAEAVDDGTGIGKDCHVILCSASGDAQRRSADVKSTNSAYLSNPTWDPTGNRFALVVAAYAKSSLVVFQEDGKVEAVVPYVSRSDDWAPVASWSSDGRRIVVVGNCGVWLFDVPHRSVREMPLPDDWDEVQGGLIRTGHEAQWSGDGSKILFAFGGAVHVAERVGEEFRVVRLGVAGDVIGAAFLAGEKEIVYVRHETVRPERGELGPRGIRRARSEIRRFVAGVASVTALQPSANELVEADHDDKIGTYLIQGMVPVSSAPVGFGALAVRLR